MGLLGKKCIGCGSRIGGIFGKSNFGDDETPQCEECSALEIKEKNELQNSTYDEKIRAAIGALIDPGGIQSLYDVNESDDYNLAVLRELISHETTNVWFWGLFFPSWRIASCGSSALKILKSSMKSVKQPSLRSVINAEMLNICWDESFNSDELRKQLSDLLVLSFETLVLCKKTVPAPKSSLYVNGNIHESHALVNAIANHDIQHVYNALGLLDNFVAEIERIKSSNDIDDVTRSITKRILNSCERIKLGIE
jgi:hypothetical protein